MRFYRNNRGATNTVELACGMFMLLALAVVPCFAIIQIGFTYACGFYCNRQAAREAACKGPGPVDAGLRDGTNAQAGATSATKTWAKTGLGAFCKPDSCVSTVLSPTPSGDDIDGDHHPDFCTVQTVIRFKPIGLNRTIELQYICENPYEAKD